MKKLVIATTLVTTLMSSMAYADMSFPSAPQSPVIYDEFTTRDGARCRQGYQTYDPYLDMGVAASNNSYGGDDEVTVFARITIPLGKKKTYARPSPTGINCGDLYRLEVRSKRQQVELEEELAKMRKQLELHGIEIE